jgi:electron transfer flavoprotein beta subunit
MEMVVCIKQVPDTTDVKIDPKTGTLIREGVPSIVNPDDKHAVEEALRLREKHGGKVTAITMGPPQAEEALREVSAMGVDETILLSDRAFAGADTLATSYTLATAVKKIGKYDIVFCGREAIDGDTAQIGPQMAEYLGIPQITYVKKVDVDGKKVIAERALEDGFERIETKTPVLLTVIADINKPRYPSIRGIVEAHREKKALVWTAKDIGADPMQTGMNGSPTSVWRSFAPEPKGKGVVLTGKTDELVGKLRTTLREKNIVQ